MKEYIGKVCINCTNKEESVVNNNTCIWVWFQWKMVKELDVFWCVFNLLEGVEGIIVWCYTK